MEWDPTIPNQTVALKNSPGKKGFTTGKTQGSGANLRVQVSFGNNEKVYKRYSVLVPVNNEQDVEDYFAEGNFSTPGDLRKIIVLEKLRGELTNVFYSMNSGNTDYYEHQFKPVLKFIESVQGRMLIADEVGLGKTIEALYIWKELQARNDARRLLIICPAMLREKWQNDLYTRFGIDGEIVNATQLTDTVEKLTETKDHSKDFVYIVSIEGIRPPLDYAEQEQSKNPRVRFARSMEQFGRNVEFSVFDLVIIDEAHYMRNAGTASNRLGQLMHDSADNLLLLTATPIQTTTENLFRILRLVDPDIFFSPEIFDLLMETNRPIIEALAVFQKSPFDRNAALEKVGELLKAKRIGADASLKKLYKRLKSGPDLSPSERSEYAATLESRSLLSRFMSRTRKRDVIENRVVRDPRVREVEYSQYEQYIYTSLSAAVLKEAQERSGIATFVLLSRQRQMASSLPAAIDAWRSGEYYETLEEYLWEDYGMYSDDIESDMVSVAADSGSREEVDLDRLIAEDSKYAAFLQALNDIYSVSPQEKCVVFAFFRNTLKYLARRLTEDGYKVDLIIGGMKPAEKQDTIRTFAEPYGPQILLSSEVGSEGIDLQFCSILMNYDLPWNPMRVEQRIGRIDRLGQKSEKISIYHFTSFDTVEERILYRLYQRINIFRESIGDLEEILGAITNELMDDIYNPNLTDEQKQSRAESTISAIENKRNLQNEIEDNAINLVGFTEYLYHNIRSIKNNNRWIQSSDLYVFIHDFFNWNYKGFIMEPDDAQRWRYKISLPGEAQQALMRFIREKSPQRSTEMHHKERVLCSFDQAEENKKYEKIDILHPLIQWIRGEYDSSRDVIHPVAAIQLKHADFENGTYLYLVQRWKMSGLKDYNRLLFLCKDIDRDTLLEEELSEKMVLAALEHGERILNAGVRFTGEYNLSLMYDELQSELSERFNRVLDERITENYQLCESQLESARRFRDRKVEMYTQRIRRFKEEGKERMVPAIEGLIKKERADYNNKEALLEHTKEIDDSLSSLAGGIIVVN